MKVERWEEETDEEWAERLTEEIAIANNTEISEYFVERDSYAEDGVIINYIGEGAWTWKEHPEGPFKADQIIGWKNAAEKWDQFRKELVFHNWSYDDMVEKIKQWGNDSWRLMEMENEEAREVQSSSGSAKK